MKSKFVNIGCVCGGFGLCATCRDDAKHEAPDDLTPRRIELNVWSEENPRDQLGLVAIAAWMNCRVDQLPKEARLHTCQATKNAWTRVADAIAQHLRDTQ